MEFNAGEAFLLLFATIGPLKAMVVCASLTAEASPGFCKQVAFRSVLVSLIICVLFAVLGEAILNMFKVSVPAFQIGGGIIVLLFSIEMVTGNKEATKDAVEALEQQAKDPSPDIAICPLAIPLMASVSGLVAIVSLIAQSNDFISLISLIGVILVIMVINYISLLTCRPIAKALGPATLQVIGRIMGVILTALAVELILMGLTGLGLISVTEKTAAVVPSLESPRLQFEVSPSDAS